MSTKIRQLTKKGEVFYPQTHVDAIVGNNGGGVDSTPTENSQNLVRSGGVQNELALGAVYDVSAHNNNATFASLEALLTDANLATLIPAAVRKGGMSVRFVQSSDNKYVQFRLMSATWSTNVSDWQGVIENIKKDSKDLITSGAIFGKFFTPSQYWNKPNYFIPNLSVGDSITYTTLNSWVSCKVYLSKGDIFFAGYLYKATDSYYSYVVDRGTDKVLERYEKTDDRSDFFYIADSDCYVAVSTVQNIGSGYCLIPSGSINELFEALSEVGQSIDAINDRLDLNKEIVPSEFNLQGCYLTNKNVGEKVEFANSASWNTHKVYLSVGDTFEAKNLADSSATLYSYVVDRDTDLILARYEKPEYKNWVYTATRDCYVVVTTGASYSSSLIWFNKSLVNNTLKELLPFWGNFKPINVNITRPSEYINNFADVTLGQKFYPNLVSGPDVYGTFIVNVVKGDIIQIHKYNPLASILNPKIVFVNNNNVVVLPTADYSSQQDLLTVTCQYDGKIMFSCATNGTGFSVDITHINFVNYANSLFKEQENINKEYITTPAYVDCPIGMNTDLFLDNVLGVEDDVRKTPLRIQGSSNIFGIGERHLRFAPEASDTNKVVTLTKYNDVSMSSINVQKVLTFRPVSRSNGDGTAIKNICISGDSLIDGKATCPEVFRLLNQDGDFIIHQIGTRDAVYQNVTYKTEGRGGWTWESFIDKRYSVYTDPEHPTTTYYNALNEFMVDEELNFQKYMQRNFPDEVAAGRGIDCFIMALGNNDVHQGSTIMTDAMVNKIIENAKVFIDALLSSDTGYPNCKVIIGLPSVGAPSADGMNSSANVFKMAIAKLNEFYLETFDNSAYHQNVTCVMHGCYIDRFNSYPYSNLGNNDYINDNGFATILSNISSDDTIPQSVKSAFTYISNYFVSSRKTRKFTNVVHPLEVGYLQFGRGIYGKIRAFLNGLL